LSFFGIVSLSSVGGLCRRGIGRLLRSPPNLTLAAPLRPKEPDGDGPAAKKPTSHKRALEDSDEATDALSKNKQKKRSRNPNKNFCAEQKRESRPPRSARLL